ncbi:MAG: manganese efflux pump [Bacteroidales bacterium]|nr:manganese efflux pump [Bacteroidales bacterium]
MISLAYILEILFLSVALSMDSFTVSITCGLQKTLTKKRTLLLAFSFAFFQALLPLLGALLGDAFSSIMSKADHWIAFALLFIIGLKMIMDGRNFKLKEKIFDVSSLKVIILLSLATSIDAFIVGISFSMMWTIMQQVIAILAIFVATFLFSFMGVKMGEKVHFIKPRIALFLGGAILILIGVKTLIEHLYF